MPRSSTKMMINVIVALRTSGVSWSWRVREGSSTRMRLFILIIIIVGVNPTSSAAMILEMNVRVSYPSEFKTHIETSLPLADGQKSRNKFRSNTSHVQILCQNLPPISVANRDHVRKLSSYSVMVFQDKLVNFLDNFVGFAACWTSGALIIFD